MKRKIIVSFIFAVGTLVSILYFERNNGVVLGSRTEAIQTETVETTYRPTATTSPIPVVSDPGRIIIPKLAVDAEVENVGADIEGKMNVPSVDINAGWWKYGVAPGMPGNAVIAGHYDKKDGGPAIFFALSSLASGDEIIVVDREGIRKTFFVKKVANYEVAEFPLELVFGLSQDKNLNLITCSGIWDTLNKNYSDRLVVFSSMGSN